MFVSRGGIRLITGTDKKNSKGGKDMGKWGIDLIAGNSDADLQPLVKGTNLLTYLTGLSKSVNELHSVLYDFLKAQLNYNGVLATHQHYDNFSIMCGQAAHGSPTAINGGKTYISPECLSSGVKSLLEGLKTMMGAVKQHLNQNNNDFNALTKIGGTKILSEKNRTN